MNQCCIGESEVIYFDDNFSLSLTSRLSGKKVEKKKKKLKLIRNRRNKRSLTSLAENFLEVDSLSLVLFLVADYSGCKLYEIKRSRTWRHHSRELDKKRDREYPLSLVPRLRRRWSTPRSRFASSISPFSRGFKVTKKGERLTTRIPSWGVEPEFLTEWKFLMGEAKRDSAKKMLIRSNSFILRAINRSKFLARFFFINQEIACLSPEKLVRFLFPCLVFKRDRNSLLRTR